MEQVIVFGLIKNMNNLPLLSVCIPSLPSRIDKLIKLYTKLNNQSFNYGKKVEIISLLDNKNMSVGKKRKNLFNIANGLYVCQIDDDDDVVDDFISTLIPIIENNKKEEVISYDQECSIDGRKLVVDSSIIYPLSDDFIDNNVMYRYPWHWCCWRNDIAKIANFYDCNGIEDSIFTKSLKSKVSTEIKLNKIMCYYNFDTNKTESPQRKMTTEEISNIQIL
jgi:hypothetical protein